MTVENLEQNGNQVEEGNANTPDNQDNKSETVALSLAPEGKTGLKLMTGEEHTLPGNRPIEASHLKFVGSYNSLGAIRPIGAAEVHTVSSLKISGNRPISAGTLAISETYSVMGSRPVASNEIDDPTALMGFLD